MTRLAQQLVAAVESEADLYQLRKDFPDYRITSDGKCWEASSTHVLMSAGSAGTLRALMVSLGQGCLMGQPPVLEAGGT